MIEIGKVYRYPYDVYIDGKIHEIVDGLPNYFHETKNNFGASNVKFQRGIHPIASVKTPGSGTRILLF